MVTFLIWAFTFGNASDHLGATFTAAFTSEPIEQLPFVLGQVPQLLSLTAATLAVSYALALVLVLLGPNLPAAKIAFRPPKGPLEPRLFFDMWRVALLEEAFFRWLPLAAIAAFLSFAPRPALVLAASAVFALAHLMNYERGAWNILWVTPQFIGGLFLAYAFYRWGFGGAVVVHFCYDYFLLWGFPYNARLRISVGLGLGRRYS